MGSDSQSPVYNRRRNINIKKIKIEEIFSVTKRNKVFFPSVARRHFQQGSLLFAKNLGKNDTRLFL